MKFESLKLDISRRHGIWILADEIYALYHYAGGRAASGGSAWTACNRLDDPGRLVRLSQAEWGLLQFPESFGASETGP